MRSSSITKETSLSKLSLLERRKDTLFILGGGAGWGDVVGSGAGVGESAPPPPPPQFIKSSENKIIDNFLNNLRSIKKRVINNTGQ